MRIAYIASYHGPGLLKRRPVVLNRSLAMTIKLELIARSLRGNSQEIEIISQGEVVENRNRFYPSFREPESFSPDIPVYYASTLPIKRLNALWSGLRTLLLFKARHRACRFDLVIIWNLKLPQLICADYAVRRLRLPVILEYEDDAFVEVSGAARKHSLGYRAYAARVLRTVSGCMACSPRLLSQLPAAIPKLLLRGVVGADLIASSAEIGVAKRNWVLFSGSHHAQYGVAALIAAWQKAGIHDWELHITGEGPATSTFKKLAEGAAGVRFHGLVSREELLRLMCTARICINPHDISQTPGNVFAFKIIEYLAAGAHVITTPMGPLEKEAESGITYLPNNLPDNIASALTKVIKDRSWQRTAGQHATQTYGPAALSSSLDRFIQQVIAWSTRRNCTGAVLAPTDSQPCRLGK